MTGRGDPRKALTALYFWTWNTEEVLEMIQWMRQYNADPHHTRKVKFYGFDMQFLPRAAKVVLDYFRKVDPKHGLEAEKLLAPLANPFTAYDFWSQTQEKYLAATSLIKKILTRFDQAKQEYINRSSLNEWAFVGQHARIVGEHIELQNSRGRGELRDSSMAENIRWILEHEGPGTKMVIWAHDYHVATKPGRMGAYLRQIFGSDMVVFGFAFNQGSFQARDGTASWALREITVGPAPSGSLDATLSSAGLRVAAIDLHAVPKDGPVAEWFDLPHDTRNIGSGYIQQPKVTHFERSIVPRIWDVLLFVEKTTAARANPGGKRSGNRKLAAPSNLDFENSESGKRPTDWTVLDQLPDFDFSVSTSNENPWTGKRCAVITCTPGRHYGEMYGSLSQLIDAAAYRGKRLKLSAAVRAEVSGLGNQAYLWLRVSQPAATTFYDNMADRPITTSEWRNYEIMADVPADAESIDYGLALVGDGRAYLDSVSIEVISK